MSTKRQLHRSVASMLANRALTRASLPRVAAAALGPSLLSSRTLTTSCVVLQNARQAESTTLASSSNSQKGSSTPTSSSYNDVLSRSRRSMLYVPGSSEKMIKKSQSSSADTIIFDLEDSVAAHKKGSARETVLLALEAAARPGPELAVRINPPSADRSLAEDDLDMVLPSRQLQAIVLPKVESEHDVRLVVDKAKALRRDEEGEEPLGLVLSVESASSLLRMPRIVEAVRESLGQDPHSGHLLASTERKPVAEIVALLFASEDYCASTGILRTRDRKSLLFPRAHMATIAKAYNLAAIDMVCIDYKDGVYLQEEAQEAKELGYDGKQAIHPVQVDVIQQTFNPTEEAVARAARILYEYEQASGKGSDKGAYGLKESDGGMTMIDRPMLLQASAVVGMARRAGMRVPEPSEFVEKA